MASEVPCLEYTRRGHDAFARQTQGIFSEEVVSLLEKGEELPIWSGEELTLTDQIARMHEHAKKYTVAKEGFKELYSHKEVSCEVHPGKIHRVKALGRDWVF